MGAAPTMFFEQLIAQLIVSKHTDSNIVLLGDFNENVYSGRISKCLSQLDLMFSEQCLQCTGFHIPPTFRDGTIPIYATFGDQRKLPELPYLLVIWLCHIAKRSLAILRQTIAKHKLTILVTSYCLNRNDRVSSFCWTRGSKQCFLTCFSYFSRYF